MSKRLRLLVTAGPTREMIDPVRFISNFSTGQMGYAVAQEAHRRGHSVTLLTGPVELPTPPHIPVYHFVSVRDLDLKLNSLMRRHDGLVMTAAVGDYGASHVSVRKIKRKNSLILHLCRTPDLLSKLGKRKGKKFIVGFCLETENLEKNAKRKLKSKNCDLMVACCLSKSQNPFGNNPLSTLILNKNGNCVKLRSSEKKTVASRLIRLIEKEVGVQ
jgi:phosphopantothenoylcysteine decarboxylase/phosphopantothenate--cysteine ligase